MSYLQFSQFSPIILYYREEFTQYEIMKIRSDLRRSMSLVMIIIIVIFCLTFYLNLVALKVTTSTSNRGFFQEFFNVDKHVFKTCLVDEHCDGGFSCKNESCVKMLFIEACNCTQSLHSRIPSLMNINNDETKSSDEIDQNRSFCSKVSAL